MKLTFMRAGEPTAKAIESAGRSSSPPEARAQAHCMQTNDFRRAYEAFSAKQKPVFQGN